MEQPALLKDFYNKDKVEDIGQGLRNAYPEFDLSGFSATILKDLEGLSLTERAWSITEAMREYLPKDFEVVSVIFMKVMAMHDPAGPMKGMDGFYYMPFGNYVAKYGLDHFDISVGLLREITIRFTAEFPIRPFLEKYPERMLKVLDGWAADENLHVRRLVSEGTRPRLPWASRLKEFQKDPGSVLRLLEKLKSDPELYVQRSVANNLNDIGKDHPEKVISVLEKWNRSTNAGTKWIVRHATRSLIKDGNVKALMLLGYDPEVRMDLTDLKMQNTVKIGHELSFSFMLCSKEGSSKDLMVDFVVHFMKSNGKRAPKVFKLSKVRIDPGSELRFEKKLSFRPISTRKYYPGLHAIEIQVNGVRIGKGVFTLIAP